MTTYSTPVIGLINQSTAISSATVASWVAPLQAYVSYHLRPHWDVAAHVGTYPDLATLNATVKAPSVVPFYIKDTSDQPGALGYHTLDAHGNPEAYIFAKTCEQYGASVTVCVTHELAEHLCDPLCSWAAQDSTGDFWALEVGDPVEADSEGFTVTAGGVGILCSNFAYPAFFVTGMPGPYDAQGKVSGPFKVMPGGYASIWNGTSWTQKQMRDGVLVATGKDDDDGARVAPRRG